MSLLPDYTEEYRLTRIDYKIPEQVNGRVPVELGGFSSATPIPTVEGLSIPEHDYIALGYTNGDLTTVTYKSGGSGGTTVATLSLAYDGNSNLTSVTKS